MWCTVTDLPGEKSGCNSRWSPDDTGTRGRTDVDSNVHRSSTYLYFPLQILPAARKKTFIRFFILDRYSLTKNNTINIASSYEVYCSKRHVSGCAVDHVAILPTPNAFVLSVTGLRVSKQETVGRLGRSSHGG